MLDAHHGERTACHDDNHLPPHHIDEREGQDEEEERDGLLEVDAKDHRQGRLASDGQAELLVPRDTYTLLESALLGAEGQGETHILSIEPS